jgi:hypothetical protein
MAWRAEHLQISGLLTAKSSVVQMMNFKFGVSAPALFTARARELYAIGAEGLPSA